MTNPSSRQCPSQVNSNFLSKSITRTACVFLAAETKVCFRGNHDFRQTPHSHDPQWHRALQPALRWTPYSLRPLYARAREQQTEQLAPQSLIAFGPRKRKTCAGCASRQTGFRRRQAGACNSVSAKARQREGACAVWV